MRGALFALAIAAALEPSVVRAQSEPTEAAADEVITEHRARPDYTQREPPGPDAGEVLIWFPRVIFAPLTFVLDHVIRRAVGWLATTAERENWGGVLVDLLTWNGRRSGIVPTFFVAYGLQPSVGLRFFSNDEVAPGHGLNASFAFGGVDFLQGNASYAIRDGSLRLELGGEGGRRPDRVFSGIGWSTPLGQYRFREAWYDAHVSVRSDFWRESHVSVRLGVDGHEFDPDGYAMLGDPRPLSHAIAQGTVERPYGLDAPYTVERTRAEIALDTREREPAPGHGLRIDAHGELAFDLHSPRDRRWVRYGCGVGGFADLGSHRVVGLWAIARFSDPIGGDPVPFTELVSLGQEALLMQGFLRGQLRGRSAVAATLEYLYPIWTMLDGRLHVSVGNAFGEHLVDFAAERLRLSFGFGIATAGDPDDSFQLMIAAGTAPFVHGAGIESVQLLLGNRRGF